MSIRVIRFIKRFKNQYRIHKRWASLYTIVKISWYQSKDIKRDINIKEISIKDFIKGKY